MRQVGIQTSQPSDSKSATLSVELLARRRSGSSGTNWLAARLDPSPGRAWPPNCVAYNYNAAGVGQAGNADEAVPEHRSPRIRPISQNGTVIQMHHASPSLSCLGCLTPRPPND